VPVCASPPRTVVKSHGLTDCGRVRPSNEDHFLIAEIGRTLWVHQSSLPQADTRHGRNRGHIFLVADGVGGHHAGEVASALTVTSMETFVLNILKRFSNLQATDAQGVVKDFQTAFQSANAQIFEETAHHPEFTGMGTTLTMAFVSGWKLFVVHAGDSRCYLYRRHRLRQLTTDHTLTADMVRNGLLRPEEAVEHQFRNIVTKLLGGSEDMARGDVLGFDLIPSDVLLLCSDGLTNMLSDDEIAAILHDKTDPLTACEALVAQANVLGGEDNVTAIVAQFEND
jgi:PPM family protein phosphatase